ncbi:MAG: glycosyltransferase family 2 protein, partial [Nitrososphaerota archaeon]
MNVIVHKENRGYGANQKTCYSEAFKRGAGIIVMLHPDYQYNPRLIPELIKPILMDEADVVLGSRFLKINPINYGMPIYKYLGNRFLTAIQNIIFSSSFSEFHTGFRAFSRRVLETIPYQNNSDGFVFDAEIVAQIFFFKFRIKEITAPALYTPEVSSIGFFKSINYGFSTIFTLLKYLLAKKNIYISRLF